MTIPTLLLDRRVLVVMSRERVPVATKTGLELVLQAHPVFARRGMGGWSIPFGPLPTGLCLCTCSGGKEKRLSEVREPESSSGTPNAPANRPIELHQRASTYQNAGDEQHDEKTNRVSIRATAFARASASGHDDAPAVERAAEEIDHDEDPVDEYPAAPMVRSASQNSREPRAPLQHAAHRAPSRSCCSAPLRHHSMSAWDIEVGKVDRHRLAQRKAPPRR